MYFICTEISNKKFIPFPAATKARETVEFPALSAHEGEEFFYVLSRQVPLHTDLYEPTSLGTGVGIYFDSSMGHALLAAGCGRTARHADSSRQA